MEQTIGQPVGRTGILRTLNIKKMIKRLLLTSTLLASSALAIQAQDLFRQKAAQAINLFFIDSASNYSVLCFLEGRTARFE